MLLIETWRVQGRAEKPGNAAAATGSSLGRAI